jgi:hypothetical protein
MSSIDFKTIPASVPSMCIPRVFKNITRERVIGVIKDLDLGIIDRVDMVQRENEKGDKFQRVFIHFKKWHSNPNADRARQMLLSGKEVKIIYDDPWFWKISANKSVSGGAPEHPQQKKPTIRFDDSPRGREPRRDRGSGYKKPEAKKPEPEPEAPTFVPRSPSSSPPRRSPSPPANEAQATPKATYICDPAAVSIDYGNLPVIAKKKRIVRKPVASTPAPALIEVKEEGEITP